MICKPKRECMDRKQKKHILPKINKTKLHKIVPQTRTPPPHTHTTVPYKHTHIHRHTHTHIHTHTQDEMDRPQCDILGWTVDFIPEGAVSITL